MMPKKNKKFTIKIQDQEYDIPYNKWYRVEFWIRGVKDKTYYLDELTITDEKLQ